MAYPSPTVKLVGNNILKINHPEPLEPKTYLTATVAAAGVTLAVKGNSGFSNTDPQDLLLFEELGNENAEIKRINGAISAGTALTVQALTYAHGIDTPVAKILFDQVEISGAATATGSKTVIELINIRVTDMETAYVVTGSTYAFYFVRFYNSLSTTPYYGAYSDALATAGFDPKNVGFIIRNAFDNAGEERGGIYSDQWIYDTIYLGELDIAKMLPRWSWLISQDYDAGNAATGDAGFTLPTDIEDNQTNKSILGIRIGTGYNMHYLDRPEFEAIQQGIAATTCATTALLGATSLILTDSRDFPDTGTALSGTTSITWSANTRSTNTLSVTALSAQVTAGDNVWFNATFSEPLRYTVTNGVVKFDFPVSSTFSGRNYWLDYYKTPTRVNSDGDTITVNDPYLIQLWLEMKIKAKRKNGELSLQDFSVLEFQSRKSLLARNERSGQMLSLVPAVPNLNRRRPSSWWKR